MKFNFWTVCGFDQRASDTELERRNNFVLYDRLPDVEHLLSSGRWGTKSCLRYLSSVTLLVHQDWNKNLIITKACNRYGIRFEHLKNFFVGFKTTNRTKPIQMYQTFSNILRSCSFKHNYFWKNVTRVLVIINKKGVFVTNKIFWDL